MRLFYFSFYFSLTWVWLFTWVWFLTWAWLIYYLSQTNCKYPSRHGIFDSSLMYMYDHLSVKKFKKRLNSICILQAFLKTCNTVDFKWCQLFVAISCLCQYVHFISWKSVLRYVISNIDLSYIEPDSTVLSEAVVMLIILFTS